MVDVDEGERFRREVRGSSIMASRVQLRKEQKSTLDTQGQIGKNLRAHTSPHSCLLLQFEVNGKYVITDESRKLLRFCGISGFYHLHPFYNQEFFDQVLKGE